MGRNRGYDWFRQSRDDLLWARDTLGAGRYAQACFATQQVGEKALKALALKQGSTEVRSHSILEVARALKVDGEIEAIAKRLDQYFISSRYPDAFPAGAPSDYFTKEQAEEAVRFAARVVETVSAAFGDEADSERDGGPHGADPRQK